MTKDQLETIKETIAHSIELNVNGKIRVLTEKMDDYIKSDEDWKKQAEPVIKMGENVQGFGKVSLYVIGFVAAISGAIMGVIKLIERR